VSRSTRASIASSLLALSLLAAGCGSGATHEQAEVRRAFTSVGFQFTAVDQLLIAFGFEKPQARPLDSLLAFLRAAANGTIAAPARIPYPSGALVHGDVQILIYPSTSMAMRAEDGIEWISAHVDQIREQVRREYPGTGDDEAYEDFDVARKDNVVVTYTRAAERRVRAALDRLD